ncbi:hypothetical protein Cob_v010187 [Colletotrichum orbiculare MAFF 240422]|uniref:Uncharacterized protein n=1 Tax=Colletotrichum orbiculare (strain 104-T / ATCC 96160 / CBS 514.97 / LARS 414 / MAFF 240422) TaxID=1213857 RepID=A0A484FHC4_COLOR|nr:hypothetical protein Cob_v010187 [Colletotrichum orbiculare MAFF 240422]
MRVNCLCGAVLQQVEAHTRETGSSGEVLLCLEQSDVERHVSGLLCTSYYPIAEPTSLAKTTSYVGSDGWTRIFCATCGCHVFRCRRESGSELWEVATGTLLESSNDNPDRDARFAACSSTPSTGDGGISVWLQPISGQGAFHRRHPENSTPSQPTMPSTSLSVDDGSLPASCACGNVSFHITRPNERSRIPHSGYPDLQYAAYKHSPEFMRNPKDEKWWIQDGGRKYLAGTCACRSCRLASGFEIQTWAFVPRANIFFHIAANGGEQIVLPLDFAALPPNLLRTYESTPGVQRESCPTCGATVFWHDKWRPDVIDVSVGLLRAKGGARAESWLSWWTGRCSFEEETARDREGEPARVARRLIDVLERGLRSCSGVANISQTVAQGSGLNQQQ